jgi:hypothetical protein
VRHLEHHLAHVQEPPALPRPTTTPPCGAAVHGKYVHGAGTHGSATLLVSLVTHDRGWGLAQR